MSVTADRAAPIRRGRRRVTPGRVALGVVVALIALFILAPLIVVALSSVTSSGYLAFPPKGFSLRWYANIPQTQGFLTALGVSVQLGLVVTVISVLCGVPAAYAIARYPGRTLRALEQVFLSPLMLPAVVLGLGLLFALSPTGFRGTFTGAVLAHVILASPFVVRSGLAGLQGLDVRLEEASRSLGAGPVRTFLRIVVPSIRGSIASGAIFAFVISFDEAVVTLFLTGSRFTTLPVTIFTYVQYSNDPTVAAMSTVLVAVCTALVLLMMWLTRTDRRRGRQ